MHFILQMFFFDDQIMEIINLEPDYHSVLTNISANESPISTPRSICVHTDERFIGFQKNDDPNTAEYMAAKLEKTGWMKYKHQCWQFGIPPIRTIKDCLYGQSDLNLSVSCIAFVRENFIEAFLHAVLHS